MVANIYKVTKTQDSRKHSQKHKMVGNIYNVTKTQDGRKYLQRSKNTRWSEIFTK